MKYLSKKSPYGRSIYISSLSCRCSIFSTFAYAPQCSYAHQYALQHNPLLLYRTRHVSAPYVFRHDPDPVPPIGGSSWVCYFVSPYSNIASACPRRLPCLLSFLYIPPLLFSVAVFFCVSLYAAAGFVEMM